MTDFQQDAWSRVANDVSFTLQPDLSPFLERVPTDGRILDYGCGYGRISELLFRRGHTDLVGVDTSAAMIARARQSCPDVFFTQLDSYKTPFANDHFNGIVVCAVLSCTPDVELRQNIIRELARVLAPGGVIHFSEFLLSPTIAYQEGSVHQSSIGVQMKHFSSEELESALAVFHKEAVSISHSTSLTGEKIPAIHYLASKAYR